MWFYVWFLGSAVLVGLGVAILLATIFHPIWGIGAAKALEKYRTME